MLSDEQLEIISEALQPLFQYLEHEVIADIARRIKKTLTYSRTAELQALSMKALGYSPARIRKEAMRLLKADPDFRKQVAKNTLEYKREVRNTINDIVKKAFLANDEIVAGAGDMAWISDLSVWKDAGKTLTDNSYLHQLVRAFADQTAGELKNLTQTTGFKTMSGHESVKDAYRNELDKAVIKICSGTFSQDKVLRDTVHDLAQSGLRSIDFDSGRSMQLDTAARVAIRTGCHQLAGKVSDKNIAQTGENLVYVSKHRGARNTGTGHANHEQWQGKVYYIKPGQDYRKEAERIGQDYITDLWYATGYSVDGAHENDPSGLDGYNCRQLVIGVPGGAFSFDEYFDNNFGITNFYVSNAIIPDYVIYNSLYVDTLPEFLETMKKNLNNRYGYETDQIFISNYALNYPASKSEQVLTYLTCKTSDLLARVNGLDIYNIYDCNSKKNSINKLISTLQEYAGISVI